MNIRSFLLPAALCGALIAPVAVVAQQAGQAPEPGSFSPAGHGQHERHHGRFMAMLRGVDLSDQQRTQIRQIVQQFRQSHPEGTQMDPQARRQAREQMRQQIMNVLTPEQRARVQQNMQQMRSQWQASPAPQTP